MLSLKNEPADLKRLFLTVTLFLILPVISFSQEIKVNCNEEPLNQVLIKMTADYDLLISFDDALLSTFRLTVNKTFQSADQALDDLLQGLPLRWEKISGVYVIYKYQQKQKSRKFLISGKITDSQTLETLPFAGIQINGVMNSSDLKGSFSAISFSDSLFRLRISYIGYYILDTTVSAGSGHSFRLTPSVTGLKEIVISSSSILKTIQAGTSPGLIRLNHKIAYYLPGNGDNSVFNLLRLQPGIVASGEKSADLIIWGSYEGQSQVIFDGFTIYGMKNFNDNISSVNPFMAKDIKVMKGGYGAEYGERAGGIIDITGVDGDKLSPSARFCINNMTVNGITSVPFNRKSSLIAAYRQTYYDLYNPVSFSTSSYGRGRYGGSQADYYLTPDYLFRDMNLKFSSGGSDHDFFISLYGGSDRFSYNFDQETMQKQITINHNEKNLQAGATAFYGFRWNSMNTSNLIVSLSSLQTIHSHNEEIARTSGPQNTSTIHNFSDATLTEVNVRMENRLKVSENHMIEAGAGYINYFTVRQDSTLTLSTGKETTDLGLPYIYMQDNYNLKKKIIIRPGIRADIHTLSGKLYIQPRFSAAYLINDNIRINTAGGIYNQFVSKNMILETTGNYRLAWSVCDGEDISVLSAKNMSLGVLYTRNGYSLNAEAYIKAIGGLTRFIETTSNTIKYSGEARVRGIDFFAKKDFKDQTFWISYTLSSTLEHFPYFPDDDFIPAMQDQRHELKFAALTKLRSFNISASYVYGSGFPDPAQLPDVVEYARPYSRLDASVIYRILNKKVNLDAGVSVLNVLNTENIRYSNFTRIPTDETNTISLYSEAVPLTPTIFLSIYF